MIERLIAVLPEKTDAQLQVLLTNARRPAQRGRPGAVRLEEAILAEAARRRLARLMPEGGLWWEPHDAGLPQFHGYADAQAARRVATILKRTTHKGHDKEVYTVEVMGTPLPGRFHHVAEARTAGSAAWRAAQ